jgi:putative transposase
MNDSKKAKIKETLNNTRERRSHLSVKTYELKIDKSKLSKEQQDSLWKLFLEAKWVYNHILSLEDRKTFDSKTIRVMVMNKDKKMEERELSTISSQIKQSLETRISNAIHGLSVLKKNGHKVGKLKFKADIDSITLKQYGVTYKINKDYNILKIQGIKNHLHVRGIDQIQDVLEFGSANLIRKGNDYFLNVTCYEEKKEKQLSGSIGMDFGFENSLTLSNGETYNILVPVSKKARKLHKKLSREIRYAKNGGKKPPKNKNKKKIQETESSKAEKKKVYKAASRNRIKTKKQLQKAYEHTNNQKKDLKNKVVSKIVNTYEIVCFQDENIRAWQAGRHGKKVNQSALGGIMRDLKIKSHTPVMVDKFFPSTKECRKCYNNTYHPLSKRYYECDDSLCGYKHPRRDVHSACSIEEGLRNIGLLPKKVRVPRESRDFKPAEKFVPVFASANANEFQETGSLPLKPTSFSRG